MMAPTPWTKERCTASQLTETDNQTAVGSRRGERAVAHLHQEGPIRVRLDDVHHRQLLAQLDDGALVHRQDHHQGGQRHQQRQAGADEESGTEAALEVAVEAQRLAGQLVNPASRRAAQRSARRTSPLRGDSQARGRRVVGGAPSHLGLVPGRCCAQEPLLFSTLRSTAGVGYSTLGSNPPTRGYSNTSP
jgi:hypothetical protein